MGDLLDAEDVDEEAEDVEEDDEEGEDVEVDDEEASIGESLVLLTAGGFVKRTPLKAFKNVSPRGKIIISLGAGDSLRWARRCKAEDNIFVSTR